MTSISTLVDALRASGLDPTAVDMAEALWLSEIIDGPVAPPIEIEREAVHEASIPLDAPLRLPITSTPSPDDPPAAELHPYPADDTVDPTAGALRLRSPGVPALPHALEMGRALRALRRNVPSSHLLDMDEAATADRVAQERVWIPVLRPRLEPEADLAVIVDSSSSMAVWNSTVRELLTLMQRLGAFRAIRAYSMNADDDGPSGLRPLGTRVAPPIDVDAIVDPTRRRLIIVLTDGVGAAWHNGRMDNQLQRWGAVNRLQVLCLLPRRMWRATGIRTRTASTDRRRARLGKRVAVPVMELSLAAIRRRASRIGHHEGAATLLPPADSAETAPRSTEPAELVRRFLALASPTAQRLAGYLAAAPLTMPAMRLVQRVMLPGSAPTHLAEVYLSGLIQERSPASDTDAIQFEFLPGVRELLLDSTDRADAIRVLTVISKYLTDRFGRQTLDFPALLRAPETAEIPELNAGALPIARIAGHVLRGFGPRFAVLADRLDVLARGAERAARSEITPEQDPKPSVRGLVLGVDIVDFASLDGDLRAQASHLLAETLRDSLDSLDQLIDVSNMEFRPHGDGMFLALNRPEEPVVFLISLLNIVARSIERRSSPLDPAVRLRFGVSAGMVDSTHIGVAGDATIEAARLLDSTPLHSILRRRPDVRVAALISNDLFEEAEQDVLEPFMVEVKGHQKLAWLWHDPPLELAKHSGRDKLNLVRHLGSDWQSLADVLDIPADDRAKFSQGAEAWALWEWLETRNRLDELAGAVQQIGRLDLGVSRTPAEFDLNAATSTGFRTVLVCVRTPLAAQTVASTAARLGMTGVVRTAVSETEAMIRLAERPAEVVLADTAVTRPDSVGFTRRVLARAPQAQLVLFGAEDPRIAAAAVAAGARGVIRGVEHDLVSVVAKALLLLLLPVLPQVMPPDTPPAGRRPTLTERELQVLRGIADGQSAAETGRQLSISGDTVKVHTRRMLKKLEVGDRAHAVAVAFRAGLLSGTTVPAVDGGTALTERELLVLRGIADGKSKGEIGREMFVNEELVNAHVRRILRKLDAVNQAHAAAIGLTAGLIE